MKEIIASRSYFVEALGISVEEGSHSFSCMDRIEAGEVCFDIAFDSKDSMGSLGKGLLAGWPLALGIMRFGASHSSTESSMVHQRFVEDKRLVDLNDLLPLLCG